MSAPRAALKPPYGWCAVLAAADDDVLGTALAAVGARHRQRSPELLEVTHYRHQGPPGEHGTSWFLFIAVVMGGAPEGDLADTHPSLARDLWQTADLWTHSFPTFRRFPPGAPQLKHYHRTPAGIVLPAPPPARAVRTPAAPPKRAEAEEPVKAAVPVPEQKGLFG